MNEQIRKEYRRVHLVLQSKLNSPNRIDVINSLAIRVVTDSFEL